MRFAINKNTTSTGIATAAAAFACCCNFCLLLLPLLLLLHMPSKTPTWYVHHLVKHAGSKKEPSWRRNNSPAGAKQTFDMVDSTSAAHVTILKNEKTSNKNSSSSSSSSSSCCCLLLLLLLLLLSSHQNRSFYRTTSVHPESAPIHPREIKVMWSQQSTVKQSEPNSRNSSRYVLESK